MACDTIYRTSKVKLDVGADHAVLADALKATGWRVTRQGTTLEATHQRTGATFIVGARSQSATIEARQYVDTTPLRDAITQEYTARAAILAFDPYELDLQERTVEADGALRLTFRHRGA